jgi:hypothetical protein
VFADFKLVMPIKRYKPEQIVTMLRQIEVSIANGNSPQHGAATFGVGLPAAGTADHLAKGAWRYGKRCAFPTSPHPRRLRTNV